MMAKLPRKCPKYRDGKHRSEANWYKRSVGGQMREGYEMRCSCGFVTAPWRPASRMI